MSPIGVFCLCFVGLVLCVLALLLFLLPFFLLRIESNVVPCHDLFKLDRVDSPDPSYANVFWGL